MLWQRGGLHPPSPSDSSTGPGSRAATLPLPAGAVQAFDAHGSIRIIALGYTADGSSLVTVGRDGTIKLWSAASGAPVAKQLVREASSGGVVGAAVSPDHRTLAVIAGQGLPLLFTLPDLQPRPPLPSGGNRGALRSVGFARDGRLAVGDATGFRVWGPDGGLLTASPRVTAGPWLAFAPDGRTVALGGETVRLCDPANGQERSALGWEEGWLTGLAYAPGGSVLAGSGSTGVVVLWEADGQVRGKLRHPGAVSAVTFYPDGRRLVAATESTALHVWSILDGQELGTRPVFAPPRGAAPWFGDARAIAFRPDGREFAVACGGAVAVFPADVLPGD
jgi:WD40 repeat protein